ncbi:UNVERIFIED_CONTAM: hypothetical protein FKN15_064484 [Acipenser sinensis]
MLYSAEPQAGTVGDSQQLQQIAEEQTDTDLEEDDTSCREGGDMNEGDISDSSLFSDIPESQTAQCSIV